MATIEYEVKRQIAFELEKSMSLKDPGGHRESWPWGNADKVTEVINDMDNANLLRIISGAVEARLTTTPTPSPIMKPMSTAPIDGRPFWAEVEGPNGTFRAWLYYLEGSGFMRAGFDGTQGSVLLRGWFPQHGGD